MKKNILVLSILMNILFSGAAHANQELQLFTTCLTDSMNGLERKNLAKWVFLGMSAHSMIKPYSNVSEKDIDTSNRYVGSLITRLITKGCPVQAKAASKVMGPAAFEQAFKVVGEVAMQELMTEPSVGQSLGAFRKYLDREKFNKVFQ